MSETSVALPAAHRVSGSDRRRTFGEVKRALCDSALDEACPDGDTPFDPGTDGSPVSLLLRIYNPGMGNGSPSAGLPPTAYT